MKECKICLIKASKLCAISIDQRIIDRIRIQGNQTKPGEHVQDDGDHYEKLINEVVVIYDN